MINNIFSNLSRGIFYTIGKVIAIALIGFLIYLLLTKFDVKYPKTYNEEIFNLKSIAM